MRQKNSKGLWLGLVVGAVLIGGFVLRGRFAGPVSTEPFRESFDRGQEESLSRQASSRSDRGGTTQVRAEKRRFEVRRDVVNRVDPATSAPLFAVDPENQPRAFLTMDFRNLDAPPPGFRMENVAWSSEGFSSSNELTLRDGCGPARASGPRRAWLIHVAAHHASPSARRCG